MAVNSKRKGAAGERELAKKLNEYGYSTRRSVQYNGKADDGKADLVNLPGIHIECKRVERLNVSEAMAQAINDTKGEMPTVFHRKSREGWLVTMRLEDWMDLYKAYKEAEK
jgi:Holliday junction resolvase